MHFEFWAVALAAWAVAALLRKYSELKAVTQSVGEALRDRLFFHWFADWFAVPL